MPKNIPILIVQSANSTSTRTLSRHLSDENRGLAQFSGAALRLKKISFNSTTTETSCKHSMRFISSTHRLVKQLFRWFPVRSSAPFTIQDHPESENNTSVNFRSSTQAPSRCLRLQGEFECRSYSQVGFVECTNAPRVENTIHRKQQFGTFD